MLFAIFEPWVCWHAQTISLTAAIEPPQDGLARTGPPICLGVFFVFLWALLATEYVDLSLMNMHLFLPFPLSLIFLQEMHLRIRTLLSMFQMSTGWSKNTVLTWSVTWLN